jgi:hypothetical protein
MLQLESLRQSFLHWLFIYLIIFALVIFEIGFRFMPGPAWTLILLFVFPAYSWNDRHRSPQPSHQLTQGLLNFLSPLASNCDPPNLRLLSSKEYLSYCTQLYKYTNGIYNVKPFQKIFNLLCADPSKELLSKASVALWNFFLSFFF